MSKISTGIFQKKYLLVQNMLMAFTQTSQSEFWNKDLYNMSDYENNFPS